MDQGRRFCFGETHTCFIVGAGGSAQLGYPRFCGQDIVGEILEQSMRCLEDDPQIPSHGENCRDLARRLAKRYNFDLERVYEHLAHVPRAFYRPYCNTHFMCQGILNKIAETFSDSPDEGGLADMLEAWRDFLGHYGPPVAIFTTNYDLALERVLDQLRPGYADGWANDQYRREHFQCGTPAELALVKLHGSADWVAAKRYTTLEVRRDAPFVTAPPACLAPLRRKWHTEEPYASGYDFLEQSLGTAQSLVVLGFSWRDVSVANALRTALWERDDRALNVHVYDRYPYVIEERVRLFLHESGAGRLASLLRWHHHQSCFPEVRVADEGVERGLLGAQVTLDSVNSWVRIPGEPCMVGQPKKGAFKIHWRNNDYYFESGRMVLIPRLPDRFEVQLKMTVKKYGSGWDPGLSLEDEAGNEVICARLIKCGDIWRHKREPGHSGLRIARGLRVCDRVPVDEGSSVEISVSGSPEGIVLTVIPDGGQKWSRKFQHCAEDRPRRLSLGGYAWYDDGGLTGAEMECVIGPCTIEPQ